MGGVGDEVGGVLEADREAHRPGADPGGGERRVVELAVRRRGGVADHGVMAAERCGDTGQAQPVAQRHPRRPATLRGDGDAGAVPPGIEQPRRDLVPGVVGQPRIVEPLDARMLRNGLCELSCRRALPRDPQRQRGQASVQQERLVRGEDRARLDADRAYLSDQVRPTDDDAAGRIAVAAEVFRRRVDDEVGAVLERTAHDRAGERRVDDELRADVVGDGCERG